jgi:hypothetical protein
MGSMMIALLLAVGSPFSQSTELDWVIVKGTVVSVIPSGVVVHCGPAPSDSDDPEGNVFLRGVDGYAELDPIDCRATRTEDIFKFTITEGAVTSLPVYEYLSSVTGNENPLVPKADPGGQGGVITLRAKVQVPGDRGQSFRAVGPVRCLTP